MAKLITKPSEDGGRSIKVSNSKEAGIIDWLGNALVGLSKNKGVIKLKVKTPKGPRVAVAGDVIIKHGNRRNGGVPTFVVIKA